MNASVYVPSPIKRRRATKQEVAARRRAFLEIVAEQKPMTVRQVFYQASVRDLVSKSEAGYRMVQTDLVAMRKSGDTIADRCKAERHHFGRFSADVSRYSGNAGDGAA